MKTIITSIYHSILSLLLKIPDSFISLIIRIAVWSIFWRSAQTKISGGKFLGQNWKFWNVGDGTFLLFKYEYAVPLLPSDIAAYMATFAEFFLSLAILLGFMTRLSALGFLVMTGVIQLFVFPEAWNVHILWAGVLLYLIKNGAGKISVDALLRNR